jgi:rare lipoprotein A
MRSGNKAILAALGLMSLAACGMVDGHGDAARPRAGLRAPADDGAGRMAGTVPYDSLPEAPIVAAGRVPLPISSEAVVTGDPYMIDGMTWRPADISSLDEVGYAAVLWETADGRHTANGEAYMPAAISAAHRTLPLPSYVEVTALETGRTILVRVNDRGPMLNDRIIALSPGAADQLGIAADGMAGVRVRKVSPLEQERAILRNGGRAAERIEAPAGLRSALVRRLPRQPLPLVGPVRTLSVGTLQPVQPAPVAAAPIAESVAPIRKVVPVQRGPQRPVRQTTEVPAIPSRAESPPARPPSRAGGYVVQVAALSSRARAESLARSVDGFVMPAGALFRVRAGPFSTEAAGRGALGRIRAKGYAEARLMANDAR